MWTDDSVWSSIPCAVELTVLICATNAFINQGPEEAPSSYLAFANQLPVVPHAGADPAVIKTVKEFGRHIDVWTIRQSRVTVKLLVVIRVRESKLLPWMKHFTLLRIPTCKFVVNLRIPATFVSVVPKQNARMVYVTANNLADESATCRRVVGLLPSG